MKPDLTYYEPSFTYRLRISPRLRNALFPVRKGRKNSDCRWKGSSGSWTVRPQHGIYYILADADRCVISRELKPLLHYPAASRLLDPLGLAGYWITGRSVENRTWWQNIRRVEFGDTCRWRKGQADLEISKDKPDSGHRPEKYHEWLQSILAQGCDVTILEEAFGANSGRALYLELMRLLETCGSTILSKTVLENTDFPHPDVFREWLRTEKVPLPAVSLPTVYRGHQIPRSTKVDTLRVQQCTSRWSEGHWSVEGVFGSNQWRQKVTCIYEGEAEEIPHVQEAFYPPAVVVGMSGGLERLEMEPVCSRLLEGGSLAQQRMAERIEGMHPLETLIPGNESLSGNPIRGTGAFFTGGVDSCYTAWKMHDHLQGLVFVNGFDIPTDASEFSNAVFSRLMLLAKDLGLPLYRMETDLREYTDWYALWGKKAFGACLASMAHLMAGRFARMAIPASYDEETLVPAGSMPDLDPCWSSSRMEILHHGETANRLEKVAAIREWPLAMKHLRVCWNNPDESYNCGRCEKCLRTLVLLEMTGGTKGCDSFPHGLDISRVEFMEMGSPLVWSHWQQILRELNKAGGKDRLTHAVGHAVRVNRQRFESDGYDVR